MISQHIECKPANDNYARLARYIADASHDGEKCLMTWCAGTWAGDDEYDLSITEVVDTQALNTRTTREKTYHLLISFRPEDEARLTPEVLKVIELRFADALGFGEHQRHCGVHQNTNNLHMHVAYNMIHPEKLTRHEPYRDYALRDRLCREIERDYGLTVDNGRTAGRQGLSVGAAKVEAMTGEQSFESYARSKATLLVAAMETSRSWQDVHAAFAQYGMAIRPKGAGLIVANLHGKEQVKASSVARELSLKNLTDLVGQFVPAENIQPGTERYSRQPVHEKTSGRDKLYAEYKAEHDARVAALDLAKAARDEKTAAVKASWEARRSGLAGIIAKCLSSNLERRELLSIRQEYDTQRAQIFSGPTTWTAFLKERARAGSETALSILRSKERQEQEAQEKSIDWEYERRLLEQEEKILMSGMSAPAKRQLLSVTKMERIIRGIKYDISQVGVVMFTLPDGSRIRDTGRNIYFGRAAADIAKQYARARWGNNQVMLENEIRFLKRSPEKTVGKGKDIER